MGGAPVCSPQRRRIGGPGTTPSQPRLAVAGRTGGAVGWRAQIVFRPAVGHPLKRIAHHVVQSKGIGLEASNRRGVNESIVAGNHIIPGQLRKPKRQLLVDSIGVATIVSGAITPMCLAAGTSPCRVFPFRLRQQTIIVARLPTKPPGVIASLLPADTDERMPIRLRETRVRPAQPRNR